MTGKDKTAKDTALVRVKIRLHSPDAHVHMGDGEKVRSGSVINVTQEEKRALGDNCHTTDEELSLVKLKPKPSEFEYRDEDENA